MNICTFIPHPLPYPHPYPPALASPLTPPPPPHTPLQADRDGDGELGEEEFYRVMKYKGARPLDASSDEDDE
jgi:hypothetical protein